MAEIHCASGAARHGAKTMFADYFLDYLSRRWKEGCVRGRELLYEIKLRGYTGSFSHLERLLAKWRRQTTPKS